MFAINGAVVAASAKLAIDASAAAADSQWTTANHLPFLLTPDSREIKPGCIFGIGFIIELAWAYRILSKYNFHSTASEPTSTGGAKFLSQPRLWGVE